MAALFPFQKKIERVYNLRISETDAGGSCANNAAMHANKGVCFDDPAHRQRPRSEIHVPPANCKEAGSRQRRTMAIAAARNAILQP